MEITSIVILAKLSTGKIHQIPVDKISSLNVLQVIKSFSKDGAIPVMEEPMTGIDWETKIDLRK